jgi:UDP-glucose 6-dehydrogenase
VYLELNKVKMIMIKATSIINKEKRKKIFPKCKGYTLMTSLKKDMLPSKPRKSAVYSIR